MYFCLLKFKKKRKTRFWSYCHHLAIYKKNIRIVFPNLRLVKQMTINLSSLPITSKKALYAMLQKFTFNKSNIDISLLKCAQRRKRVDHSFFN